MLDQDNNVVTANPCKSNLKKNCIIYLKNIEIILSMNIKTSNKKITVQISMYVECFKIKVKYEKEHIVGLQ